jgi:hypothetical protein
MAVPVVGVSRPARMRRIVDLPQPEGPSSDRKVDRRERLHLLAPGRERLAEALDVDAGGELRLVGRPARGAAGRDLHVGQRILPEGLEVGGADQLALGDGIVKLTLRSGFSL